jgi:hypothetical protein
MVKLHFARLQTALFISSLGTAKILDLAATIRDNSNGLLDADPLMLPVPSDAPAELPRLVLKSSDQHWTYQVSGGRCDFVFEATPEEIGSANLDEITAKQVRVGSNIWKAMQSKYNIIGHRIGVINLFAGSPDDSVNILRSQFIIPSNTPEPNELQLHALHRLSLGSVTVNRWTRCVAGELPPPLKSIGSLRVEIDINTLPEQNFNLTPDKIITFINNAGKLALSTMTSLFEDEAKEKVF